MKNKKTMKWTKRILSILTVICCLAGSLTPLSARAGSEVTAGANPRIVFTNEPKKSPDLYVSKIVETADGSKVPEEEDGKETGFEFTLELDGKAVKKAVYHLYNGSVAPDNEVSAGDSDKDKHTTDIVGRFWLKAGQIAVFLSEENPSILRQGVKYKVTESDSGENYILKKSEGTEGSIGENGARAKFTNEYLPQGAGTDAKLDIAKKVIFPDGYKMPETPYFSFHLKLNNQPCADTVYEVIDTESGEKIGDGETDENGLFTLQGGQTARFTKFNGEKIKTGVQYEVTELNLPGNWRAVGSNAAVVGTTVTIDQKEYSVAAVEKGSTAVFTKVYFENINAAFGVKKIVEGETKPDIDFTFELTHGDRSQWPGAAYYLYNAAGNRILNTAEGAPGDGSFATDEDGRFHLKHGQTAVFYGIDAGEKYNVREVKTMPSSGEAGAGETAEASVEGGDAGSKESAVVQKTPMYVQSQPQNPAGYTDNTVSDTTPVWEFRNKPSEGGLTVTKAVTNNTDETAFREVDFSFRLLKGEKKEDDGRYEWEPVKRETFIRNEGGVEEEGSTGNKDGSFTLKADGTIVFPYLESGHYKVVESVEDTPEYSVANPDENPENPELKGLTQTVEGDYEAGSTVVFSFENIYEAWKFDLRMVKQDGEENYLAGAEFRLYWDGEMTNPVTTDPADEDGDNASPAEEDDYNTVLDGENTGNVPTGENGGDSADPAAQKQLAGTFTTDEKGIAVIPNLKSGTYTLEEAKAPSGYAILFAPITLEVIRTETGIQVILDNGNADPDIVRVTGTRISDDNENDLVEITVYNTRLYKLPSSGGMGIYWYLIGGVLLMMAAVLILYKNKNTEEVQGD